VWRLFRSSNLRAVEPVVHLGVSLQIPVAIYHRDLRRPRDLDDLGIEQRVSSLLYTAVSCSPHACRCSQEKTIWECQNGGQLWGDSANAGYANTASFPDGVCAPGFQSLYTAFIVSLLVDLAFHINSTEEDTIIPNRARSLVAGTKAVILIQLVWDYRNYNLHNTWFRQLQGFPKTL
jgi:hypothetical protein